MSRRRFLRPRHTLVLAAALGLGACTDPLRLSAEERRAIADSLEARVVAAYDFAAPGAPERLLSLYPDSGRVISAVAGRATTTRDTLASAIRGFWARVGQNMQQPRFVVGSTYVDVITRDAAVLTLTYAIPHTTPQGTPHTVSGAWTMLWRRSAGGDWRIVQEHLSDTPESTQSAVADTTAPPSAIVAPTTPPAHRH